MKQKARSRWAQLRQRSATLRRSLKQLTDDLAATSSLEDVNAIIGAASVNGEIQAWKNSCLEALAQAESASSSLVLKGTEQAETLDERLARGLRDVGYSVYGETALFVVDGILHVETEARKGIVRVNGVEVSDSTVESVKAHVGAEMEQLKKLVAGPEKFIALLLGAYQSEIAVSKKEFGSQVQTSSLLWHLALARQQAAFKANPVAANFRDYSREVFRADLYGLLSSNLTEVDRKRFRYSSGSDTAGAVFTLVPQLGRTAHIGRIWFENSDD